MNLSRLLARDLVLLLDVHLQKRNESLVLVWARGSISRAFWVDCSYPEGSDPEAVECLLVPNIRYCTLTCACLAAVGEVWLRAHTNQHKFNLLIYWLD
jgi:hypothetical protein